MNEADLIRGQLDQVRSLLDVPVVFPERKAAVHELLDEIDVNVARLERKAYIVIPTPGTLWRRLTGRMAS